MKYSAFIRIVAVLVFLILGGHHVLAQEDITARLQIPSLGIDIAITTAYISGDTWDFRQINSNAAFLDLLPLPGDSGNTVIGAHSELAARKPGPFYELEQIQANDEIIITYDGETYHYVVQDIWHVAPSDLSPLYPTEGAALTLLTCDDYNPATGAYDQRLIVRATETD